MAQHGKGGESEARPARAVALTQGMPETRVETGDVLFTQGDAARQAVGVLVTGRLRVELDGVALAEVAVPGAFVGEIGALLGTVRSADVVALAPTTVRLIGDPDEFFASHPDLALELARQLAGRLHRLLAYLGDVRSQYSDADGHLGVLDSVLGQLASRPPVEIEPGSDRSPDY
ncbi:MAG: Crp/Fnr family transcriptional regulator [Acidimicrobiales bacterium]